LQAAYSAVGAGDAATSPRPRRFFWAKFGQIWGKFGKDLDKFRQNLYKFARFRQNQNLTSPKTLDLIQLWVDMNTGLVV